MLSAAISSGEAEQVEAAAEGVSSRELLQQLFGAMQSAISEGVAGRLRDGMALSRLSSLQEDIGKVQQTMHGRRQRAAVQMLQGELQKTQQQSSSHLPSSSGVVCALLHRVRGPLDEAAAARLLQLAAQLDDERVIDESLKRIEPGRQPIAMMHLLLHAAVTAPAAGALAAHAKLRLSSLLQDTGLSPCQVDAQHSISGLEWCVQESQLELAALLLCHASAATQAQQHAIEWALQQQGIVEPQQRDFLIEALCAALRGLNSAKGGSVQHFTDCAQSALRVAFDCCLLEVAQLLAALGADCSSPELFGVVARSSYSEEQHAEWAELLAQMDGADFSSQDNLDAALAAGSIELLQMALDEGCDVTGPPVSLVVREMRQIRGSALISGDVPEGSNRWEFLQAALDALLESGATVREPDLEGYTALDMALCVGEPEVVWLMQLGGAQAEDGYAVHALLSMLLSMLAAEDQVAIRTPWEQHCAYLRATAREQWIVSGGTPPSAAFSASTLATKCGETQLATQLLTCHPDCDSGTVPSDAAALHEGTEVQRACGVGSVLHDLGPGEVFRPSMTTQDALKYLISFEQNCKVAVVTTGHVPPDLVALFFAEGLSGTKQIAQVRLNSSGACDALVQCTVDMSPLVVELRTNAGWSESQFSTSFKASGVIQVQPLI